MSERDIFGAALEKTDPAERAAYLEQVCGSDAALRRRVEALLRTHASAGDFLARPVVLAKPDQGDTFEVNAEQTADEDNVLELLEASTKSGSLGRLAHYEVLEVLGKGGFGTVVKAFDEKLQRMVAIKIMAPQLAATSPARKRFLREARSAAAIRHENVVAIHAIEEQPIPFLVMEYVAGGTLQQRLDSTGPLDALETLRIAVQLAHGLAAAHALGKVHRDIKPANILLENRGQVSGVRGQGSESEPSLTPDPCPLTAIKVKITDFGLARAADDASLTQSGVVAGTPMYMAPEQAQGMAIDHRADLFSLGSVLYVMCSGRPPFRAATTLAVLNRVAEDTPRPIREIVPEAPQWLCDIITRLHAKKAEDRFASAGQVADLLARCLAELQRHGKVQSVEPAFLPAAPERNVVGQAFLPAAADRNVCPTKRRRWLAVAAALVAMMLIALSLTEATGVTNVLQGTIVRLFSSEGTLLIQVDDPDVSVSIDGEELIIKGAGAKEIRVKPGQYNVQASKDGKVVRQELVTVTNNGRQVVRISRESAPLATPVARGNDRQAAEWVLSLGGTVVIDDGLGTSSSERTIKAANELPATAWLLRRIDLNANKAVDDTAVMQLAGLTSLYRLELRDTKVTDEAMKMIARLSGLKELYLYGTKVTDAGVKELAGLNLELLSIGDTKIVQPSLKELSGLTYLQLGNTSLTPAAFKELAPLKNLRTLVLRYSGVTDAGLKELAGLSLQTLDLCAAKLTDAGLKNLAGLTSLEQLMLDSTKLTDAGLKELAGLKVLRRLWLNRTQVSDAGLVYLHGLTELTTLDLTQTKVTDEGIATLQKALPDCQIASNMTPVPPSNDRRAAEWVLSLGGTANTFTDAKMLPSAPCIVSRISLAGKPASDAGLKELAGLRNLDYLDLEGAKVTDAGLKELAGLKGLRFLRLAKTRVTDAGLKELAGLHSLEQLNLSSTAVTGAGLKHLVGLKGLKVLNLAQTQVSAADLKELAELTNLEMLAPGNVKATDLKELACFTNLRTLFSRQHYRQLEAKAGVLDLIQETFLEAKRDFGSFHGHTEKEWLAWLRQLLLHNLANLMRSFRTAKRQIDCETPLHNNGLLTHLHQLSPMDQAIANEQAQQIHRVLRQMPRDYRQVILLRYRDNCSFSEISQRFGRSENAVRKLVARAVDRVQQELEAR